MPKVSIILPVYNMEETIGRAIDSILAQTFKNWELVIVDDGSTDRTFEVIRHYVDNFGCIWDYSTATPIKKNRIVVCRLYENVGRPRAYNCAISLTKHKLIAIQNGDDVYALKKLERQIEEFQKDKDLDVLGTGVIRNGKNYIHPKRVTSKIYQEMAVNHATIMFKKECFFKVGGYDSKFPRCSDWDFCCKLFAAGCKMRNIDDLLYTWYPNKYNQNYQKYAHEVLNKWRVFSTNVT